jgi:hypothetical protein
MVSACIETPTPSLVNRTAAPPRAGELGRPTIYRELGHTKEEHCRRLDEIAVWSEVGGGNDGVRGPVAEGQGRRQCSIDISPRFRASVRIRPFCGAGPASPAFRLVDPHAPCPTAPFSTCSYLLLAHHHPSTPPPASLSLFNNKSLPSSSTSSDLR